MTGWLNVPRPYTAAAPFACGFTVPCFSCLRLYTRPAMKKPKIATATSMAPTTIQPVGRGVSSSPNALPASDDSVVVAIGSNVYESSTMSEYTRLHISGLTVSVREPTIGTSNDPDATMPSSISAACTWFDAVPELGLAPRRTLRLPYDTSVHVIRVVYPALLSCQLASTSTDRANVFSSESPSESLL